MWRVALGPLAYAELGIRHPSGHSYTLRVRLRLADGSGSDRLGHGCVSTVILQAGLADHGERLQMALHQLRGGARERRGDLFRRTGSHRHSRLDRADLVDGPLGPPLLSVGSLIDFGGFG